MPGRKRNVRKLHLRPPLPRRAIVWFPEFPDGAPVERFRRRFDPAGEALPAHLTLVFPFATSLTVTQVASHVRRAVANWPIVPVTFRDVEGILEEYVILMVRERAEAVIALHDRLYRGVLQAHLREDIPYLPHLTVGRVAGSPSGAGYEEMYAAAARELRGEWRCLMRELAIVTTDPDGTIRIDQTIPLNFG